MRCKHVLYPRYGMNEGINSPKCVLIFHRNNDLKHISVPWIGAVEWATSWSLSAVKNSIKDNAV